MDANTARNHHHVSPAPMAEMWMGILARFRAVATSRLLLQLLTVFAAYYVAGKLGQATSTVRSGNLGPVWPAYGIAVASLLACGYRVWPAVAASAFLIALQSPVSALTAAGQAIGATLAASTGTFLLRRVPNFDPALPRLRDALAFIALGAFASATISASIGVASLHGADLPSYSSLASGWLIYWLGDATGVLLVTPLVFTVPALLDIRSRRRILDLLALLALVTVACVLIFGALPQMGIQLDVLVFAVLPFVMWAAIEFGIAGASLSIFVVATIATVFTALGAGPFSVHSPFVNAILLDVLFTVLTVSGLALAAVIVERERAEAEHERLILAQASMETRLHLAAIVESSNDAIISMTLDGIILSWNAAAERIFGFTETEAIGQPMAMLIPAALRDENRMILQRLRSGRRIDTYESLRLTKTEKKLHVAITVSPLRDAEGTVVAAAAILRDITERKQAEEAMSNVSRRLIEAQEQERIRIARDLHDDIGQRLALLALNLTGLTGGRLSRLRLHGQSADLQRQVADIAAGVQALSHELHSSRLELLGITAAMRHFCGEFATRQKATVDFESRDLPAHVSPDVSLCLFRILQEALHNAAKHSGVRRFEVRLWGAHGQVHLTVSDHGKGFDPDQARLGRGIGLVSMQERVKLVGGDLTIESGPQHGTTIHARAHGGPLPVPPAASDRPADAAYRE